MKKSFEWVDQVWDYKDIEEAHAHRNRKRNQGYYVWEEYENPQLQNQNLNYTIVYRKDLLP